MNSFFHKLRWLTRRSDKEAQLREELQFHLQEEAEHREDDGLREDEARWAAGRHENDKEEEKEAQPYVGLAFRTDVMASPRSRGGVIDSGRPSFDRPQSGLRVGR